MKIFEDYNNEAIVADVIDVINATYIDDYKIKVGFSDLTEKTIDFKPFLLNSIHPAIGKYRDENLFKSFEISGGNLNWNDYELIFPVYDLYLGRIS